jgi:hypothetical protein
MRKEIIKHAVADISWVREEVNPINLLGLQKESNFLDEFSLSELMSNMLIKMKTKVNSDSYYLSAHKVIKLIQENLISLVLKLLTKTWGFVKFVEGYIIP